MSGWCRVNATCQPYFNDTLVLKNTSYQCWSGRGRVQNSKNYKPLQHNKCPGRSGYAWSNFNVYSN